MWQKIAVYISLLMSQLQLRFVLRSSFSHCKRYICSVLIFFSNLCLYILYQQREKHSISLYFPIYVSAILHPKIASLGKILFSICPTCGRCVFSIRMFLHKYLCHSFTVWSKHIIHIVWHERILVEAEIFL
jgi:hypothetical protein